MVGRISTNQLSQAIIKQMQDQSSKIADTSYQISSGYKSQSLSGVADEASQLLTMRELKSNNDTYIKNIETVTARLKATDSTLQSLSDLMVEAKALSTTARNESSAAARSTLAPQAQGLAQTFFSVLQTEFDGRYLFSGQNAGVSPISGSPTATSAPSDPPPTTYYLGDSSKPSVITGSGTSESYGITGDDTMFSRIKAGLEALMFGLQNDSDIDIDGAIDLLDKAKDSLSDSVGEIGGQIKSFDLQTAKHTSNQSFLTERIDDIDKVDIAEALTEFTQQQASLEASMAVISRVSSLSLLDYLR